MSITRLFDWRVKRPENRRVTMRFSEHRGPTILTVPGLGNSGPLHWQTAWEANRSDTTRVELGLWNAPRRNAWVTKLDQAIRTSRAPVILVAHSLGCLTVGWWAALAGQPWGWPVAGALLVAPPDVSHRELPQLAGEFGPHPKIILPFPTILVASRDDPYAAIERVHDMAKDWGAAFVDAGAAGHINATSGVGAWSEGLALLELLIDLVATEGSTRALADVQSVYDQAVRSGGPSSLSSLSPVPRPRV